MTASDHAALLAQLKRHEGLRLKPYRDLGGTLTIGYGRNLDDIGISEDEAETLLQHDVAVAEAGVARAFDWYETLDGVRQRVVVDMCFNLGLARLLKFRRTLDAIAQGRYADAAAYMTQSLWAQQVGPRARYLATLMETGVDHGTGVG